MKRLLSVFTVLFFTSIAFGQKTDFSGTWTLKDQKSISGMLYSNGVPKKIKVTQTNDAVVLETTTANAQGQDITTQKILHSMVKNMKQQRPQKEKNQLNLAGTMKVKNLPIPPIFRK
jgi:hypothetical protein